MRVLVAGASGALGRVLLPLLVRRGHQVAGFVQSEAGGAWVASQGAEAFVSNALDAEAVSTCLDRFRPEAVAHQLTALPASTDLRDFDRVFAKTNALRTRGDRQPARRGAPRGRPTLRGAELLRLALRSGGRTGEDRGRPARPKPACSAPKDP
jgi:uncharacterized protein YbjT (DUF2867 family)